MTERFAFFDVDKTVIAVDSFLKVLRAGFAQNPLRLLLTLPFLPFAALTLVGFDKRAIKSAMLWSITVGKGRRGAVQFLNKLGSEIGQRYWFLQMDSVLAELRQQNLKICYVSASGQTWLRALLRKQDPHPKVIIGSKLGFFCGGVVLTSKNCYREEKLRRIAERLGNDILFEKGFSDHIADLPLLLACREKFVVSPLEKHLDIFKRTFGDGFTLLKWTRD